MILDPLPENITRPMRMVGLDPDDPLVRLAITVLMQAPRDYQPAYNAITSPDWLAEVAEVVATDDQIAVACQRYGRDRKAAMRFWAESTANVIKANPLAASVLHRVLKIANKKEP